MLQPRPKKRRRDEDDDDDSTDLRYDPELDQPKRLYLGVDTGRILAVTVAATANSQRLAAAAAAVQQQLPPDQRPVLCRFDGDQLQIKRTDHLVHCTKKKQSIAAPCRPYNFTVGRLTPSPNGNNKTQKTRRNRANRQMARPYLINFRVSFSCLIC